MRAVNMATSKAPVSHPLRAAQDSAQYRGVYDSGPFKGRPIAHPYNTVLLRLSRMGVTAPERQFDETDQAYIVRIDRSYTGLFGDIIASGILGNGGLPR